jgi:hypothetical protein
MHASAGRALGSLSWYYRTRPDAWRSLVAPGLGVFLVLWLSIAWGALGPLLALGVVGAFSVFAIGLIEELRSLETESRAGVELEAKDLPWLGRLGEAEPAQLAAEAAVSEPEAARPTAQRNLPTPSELDLDVEPAAGPSVSEEPLYEVREIAANAHTPLRSAPSFFEACDLAFELIEQRDPAELEIVRVAGEEQEIAWRYTRSESDVESERTT